MPKLTHMNSKKSFDNGPDNWQGVNKTQGKARGDIIVCGSIISRFTCKFLNYRSAKQRHTNFEKDSILRVIDFLHSPLLNSDYSRNLDHA